MYTLHCWNDSASLIVRLVLEELGLPYEARVIDRAGGALNSPAYRALSPLGKIPALETPDGPMFETAAILLYLTERHSALAPAPGSADRAAFLKWLFFTSSNVHPTLLTLFYPARSAGAENAAAVLAQSGPLMAELLTHLDRLAATRPSFLSDSQPTALGYYIAVLMRWSSEHLPMAGYTHLQRVLAYLESRPAAQKSAAIEGLGPHFFTNPS